MSHRPLVLVFGLTVGDYLLWNWSLNANHDVLALVSGLTLPPLAVACLWLLALSVARLIARSARLPAGTPGATAAGLAREPAPRANPPGRPSTSPPTSATPARSSSSSRKLAA